ncbi:MAG: hypothetical protein M0Z54_09515 [Thermaerobacter sp.]|nr:hypothetical protein [Thermaerobacter sp.]
MLQALHTLLYQEPYWLHDGGVILAGGLWLYWGARHGRQWPHWQQIAYVAGAALLAHYETVAGMTWYWGATGFALLAVAVGTSLVRDGQSAPSPR